MPFCAELLRASFEALATTRDLFPLSFDWPDPGNAPMLIWVGTCRVDGHLC
jgi:hypothetical protein